MLNILKSKKQREQEAAIAQCRELIASVGIDIAAEVGKREVLTSGFVPAADGQGILGIIIPKAIGEEPYLFSVPLEELGGFLAMLNMAVDAAAEERERRLRLARAM